MRDKKLLLGGNQSEANGNKSAGIKSYSGGREKISTLTSSATGNKAAGPENRSRDTWNLVAGTSGEISEERQLHTA